MQGSPASCSAKGKAQKRFTVGRGVSTELLNTPSFAPWKLKSREEKIAN